MNNPTMLFIGITIFVLCIWAAYHVIRFMFKDHKLDEEKIGAKTKTKPVKGKLLPPWRIHDIGIVRGSSKKITHSRMDTCKAGRGY